MPAPVQAKVQERPQAFEATLRFRSDKVIAAKVPLEHFVADLRLHQGRLALTRLSSGRRHGAGPGARRHAGQSLQSTIRTEVHQLNLQQFLSWLELRPEDAATPEATAQPKATTKPEATAQPETPGKPEIANSPKPRASWGPRASSMAGST